MPWTTKDPPDSFKNLDTDALAKAVDIANAILTQETANGAPADKAESLAIATALRQVGATPEASDLAANALAGDCDGPGRVAFRMTAPEREWRRVTYRGHPYVLGPVQALVEGGDTFQARGGAGEPVHWNLTVEHLAQMVRNAAGGALIRVIFGDDHGHADPTRPAAGVIDHTSLFVAPSVATGRPVLYGRVLLTEAAAASIAAGERPGVSVEASLYATDKDTGEEVGARLTGLAYLTGPQQDRLIVQTRFSRHVSSDVDTNGQHSSQSVTSGTDATLGAQNMNDLKSAICEALGLAPDAPDAEVVDALKAKLAPPVPEGVEVDAGAMTDEKRKVACSALALSGKVTFGAVLDAGHKAVVQLAAVTAERDALKAQATDAQGEAMKLAAQVADLSGEVGKLTLAARTAQAEREVDAASKGRAVPAHERADAITVRLAALAPDAPDAIKTAWKLTEMHLASSGKPTGYTGQPGSTSTTPHADPEVAFVAGYNAKDAAGRFVFGEDPKERAQRFAATPEGKALEAAMFAARSQRRAG
jgi:hypothetical protein